jgi:hypothetical protein
MSAQALPGVHTACTTIDTIRRCLDGPCEIIIGLANGVLMRFLLGWLFKLGFLGVAYLAATGSLQFKLPDYVLGYEVPPEARQWVERNTQIDDLARKTGASLRQISDGLK